LQQTYVIAEDADTGITSPAEKSTNPLSLVIVVDVNALHIEYAPTHLAPLFLGFEQGMKLI